MSMYKVGSKVRIQPEYLAEWLYRTPERGHTVAAVGDKNALLECGVAVPWERLAPDLDLPYEPPRPRKTLAEKEMEVYQKDPARQRRDAIWRAERTPTASAREARNKRLGQTFVRNQNFLFQGVSGYFPPGEYTVPADAMLQWVKKAATTLSGLNIGERVHDMYYPRTGTVRSIGYNNGNMEFEVYWSRDGSGETSRRPRDTLRTEAEQAAENGRLRAVVWNQYLEAVND